jgi:hypothetical protein
VKSEPQDVRADVDNCFGFDDEEEDGGDEDD